MTRSLGSLGTPRDAIDASFDYFGVVVRVNPTAGDLDLVEFMMDAAQVDAVDEMKSMAAISRYLKGLIHDDDWDTFWRTAKANRQTMEDLMALGQRIVAEASGFPTQQPSGSSGGQQRTAPKSRDTSSDPAGTQARREADTRRALELVQGRPDLKEIYLMADEERVAQAAAAG